MANYELSIANCGLGLRDSNLLIVAGENVYCGACIGCREEKPLTSALEVKTAPRGKALVVCPNDGCGHYSNTLSSPKVTPIKLFS